MTRAPAITRRRILRLLAVTLAPAAALAGCQPGGTVSPTRSGAFRRGGNGGGARGDGGGGSGGRK
jgi:hypothetical protein